jgi:hypothetical protein
MEDRGEIKTTAIVSILISALSVGVSSASMSFDWDVDPKYRKEAQTFYGYVPDTAFGRSAIYVCMVLQSAGMLLIRSFGTALLVKLGWAYFGGIFAAEMGIYLLYKLARRDACYWLPVDGVAGAFCSFALRFTIKVVTDYTGVIQFRQVEQRTL